MSIDLNLLAKELSIGDHPEGENVDVIHVKVVLGLLGRLLRQSGFRRGIAVCRAIWNRAGLEEQ